MAWMKTREEADRFNFGILFDSNNYHCVPKLFLNYLNIALCFFDQAVYIPGFFFGKNRF